MEFEAGKAKGILDRSFPSVKIPIHKDSSYADLKEKCRECVWGDPSNEYSYYMADGTGTAIGSNSFSIDLEDKTKTVLPWTLNNYIKVSAIPITTLIITVVIGQTVICTKSSHFNADYSGISVHA